MQKHDNESTTLDLRIYGFHLIGMLSQECRLKD